MTLEGELQVMPQQMTADHVRRFLALALLTSLLGCASLPFAPPYPVDKECSTPYPRACYIAPTLIPLAGQ